MPTPLSLQTSVLSPGSADGLLTPSTAQGDFAQAMAEAETAASPGTTPAGMGASPLEGSAPDPLVQLEEGIAPDGALPSMDGALPGQRQEVAAATDAEPDLLAHLKAVDSAKTGLDGEKPLELASAGVKAAPVTAMAPEGLKGPTEGIAIGTDTKVAPGPQAPGAPDGAERQAASVIVPAKASLPGSGNDLAQSQGNNLAQSQGGDTALNPAPAGPQAEAVTVKGGTPVPMAEGPTSWRSPQGSAASGVPVDSAPLQGMAATTASLTVEAKGGVEGAQRPAAPTGIVSGQDSATAPKVTVQVPPQVAPAMEAQQALAGDPLAPVAAGQADAEASLLNPSSPSQGTSASSQTALQSAMARQAGELPTARVPAERLVPELQSRLAVMLDSQKLSAEIRLDPPELGALQVRIQMNGDQAQVQITAQQGQAREMLEQHLPRLREMLAQQGLQLADADVRQGGGQGRDESPAGSEHGGANSWEEDNAPVSAQSLSNRNAQGGIDFYA